MLKLTEAHHPVGISLYVLVVGRALADYLVCVLCSCVCMLCVPSVVCAL